MGGVKWNVIFSLTSKCLEADIYEVIVFFTYFFLIDLAPFSLFISLFFIYCHFIAFKALPNPDLKSASGLKGLLLLCY